MTPPTDAAVLGGVTAESKEYFEKRSLKKGAVNWVLLMSLGVAYVISGDFSGWNYGIGYGGWFGMLIAFLVMGAMYLFMVLGLVKCHLLCLRLVLAMDLPAAPWARWVAR